MAFRMRQQNHKFAKDQENEKEKEEFISKERELSNNSSNHNSELSTQSRQSQFYQQSPSSSSQPQSMYSKRNSPIYNIHKQESPQSQADSSYSFQQHQRRYQQEQEEFFWQQQQYKQPSQNKQKQLNYAQQYHSPPQMVYSKPYKQHYNYQSNQNKSQQQQQQLLKHQQLFQNQNTPQQSQQSTQISKTPLMMPEQKNQDYISYLEQKIARLSKECYQQQKPLSQFTQVPSKQPLQPNNSHQINKPYQNNIRNSNYEDYSNLFDNINEDKRDCERNDYHNTKRRDCFGMANREKSKQFSSSLEWPLPEELIKVNYLEEQILNVFNEEKRKQFYLIGEDVSELCNDIQNKYKYLYVNQVSINQYIIGSKRYSLKVNKIIQILKEFYSFQQSKRKSKSMLYIKERNNHTSNKSNNNNINKSPSPFQQYQTNTKQSRTNNESKQIQNNKENQVQEIIYDQNKEIKELKQMVMAMLEQQQKLEQKSLLQQQLLYSSAIVSTQNNTNNKVFQDDSQKSKSVEKQMNIIEENSLLQNEQISTDINEELEQYQQSSCLSSPFPQFINDKQYQLNLHQHQQRDGNQQRNSINEMIEKSNNIFENNFEKQQQSVQLNKEQGQYQDIEKVMNFLQSWQQQQQQQNEEKEKKMTSLFQEQIKKLFEQQTQQQAQLSEQVLEISRQFQKQKEYGEQQEKKQGQEQALKQQELESEMNKIKNAINQVCLQQRVRDEFRSFVIEYIQDQKVQNTKVLNLDGLYGDIIQLYLEKFKQYNQFSIDQSNKDINPDYIYHNNQYLKGIFCDVFISSQSLINKITQQNQRESDIEKSRGGKISSNNKISMGKSFDNSSNKNNNLMFNTQAEEGEESNNVLGKSNTKRKLSINNYDRQRFISSNPNNYHLNELQLH